ncbi:hypothetical protein SAMD00019534_113260 [Acytostelium subglobosum LB1]|uniref:hypothetical protein n=1 Tax=Acytostelium subglobosum LB1 TaxID=1410327 RepID=UPI000644E717|nr:hypothetical protein SAMD00019534_113260 [Acytostelium subglobosum LB1]GAM28150.1 hypothetical protein SAMD00019534_113260 [Acytostelium subglobosum LB1]|eukprot:XP_012748784.1 hypothetical protein SAMD00019534_113260 [Acytostelium subglobosum LB1]
MLVVSIVDVLKVKVKNYEAFHFKLDNPIDPETSAYISLWLNGGVAGRQKIYARLTHDNVAINLDYLLFGPNGMLVNATEILPNTWTQAIINLDNVDPMFYDGLQLLSVGNKLQETLYIDDIVIFKRCDIDPYTKKAVSNKTIPGAESVTMRVVEYKLPWFEKGKQYQKYFITFKNIGEYTISNLKFKPLYFKPRDGQHDIWGCDVVSKGLYTIPKIYNNAFTKGSEFTVGVTSLVGPVKFEITNADIMKTAAVVNDEQEES